MFWPVLAIFRLSYANLRSYYKHACARGVEISTYGPSSKNRYRKTNKAIVGVCSAGMKFCSRAEVCLFSFSSIMLGCEGLKWPWVRDSLAYGDRDECVSRVVDYSN